MAMEALQYRPDYAVPPGWVLEERLDAQGISHAEFARRCGRSAKLISEIISGKAPVEPETALQFEKVLGVDAGIWLGIEADYRLHQARQCRGPGSGKSRFLGQDISCQRTRRGESLYRETCCLTPTRFRICWCSLESLRSRRGARSTSACLSRIDIRPVLRATIQRWQLGSDLVSLKRNGRSARTTTRAKFRRALGEIRGLTRSPFTRALQMAQGLCNDAGVALAPIKPFPKTALSGAAWWLTPRKAVIELSARHKTNDQLWFSLFHEAAHILVHSKKTNLYRLGQSG